MYIFKNQRSVAAVAVLVLALCFGASRPAQAELILNGGFESGFTGWTLADQAGGDGSFMIQNGTLTPINGFTVPAPPGGVRAAMTDAQGPGSHVLYQDVVIPVGSLFGTVSFSLFVNNGASNFFSASTLDFAAQNPNGSEIIIQQIRVDLLRSGTGAFSVATADVLQNLYQSKPGDPLVSGYTNLTVDISSVVAANAGSTVRLRFAETDNLLFLNLGVDNVSITTGVPEPTTLASALLGGVLLVGHLARNRNRKTPIAA